MELWQYRVMSSNEELQIATLFDSSSLDGHNNLWVRWACWITNSLRIMNMWFGSLKISFCLFVMIAYMGVSGPSLLSYRVNRL